MKTSLLPDRLETSPVNGPAYPYIGDYSIEKYYLGHILTGRASRRSPRQALLKIPFNLGTLVLVQGRKPSMVLITELLPGEPNSSVSVVIHGRGFRIDLNCRGNVPFLFRCLGQAAGTTALRIVSYDDIECSGLAESVTHV